MKKTFEHILKSLIEIAWADGRISPEERRLLVDMLRELADQEGVPDSEIQKLVSLIESDPHESIDPDSPRRKADLSEVELDREGKENVMRTLMAMSFVDGALSFTEYEKLKRFGDQLGISEPRMEELRKEALAAVENLDS